MAKDEEKEKSPDAWMRQLAYDSAVRQKIRPWVYISQIHSESSWNPEAQTKTRDRNGNLLPPEEQAYGLTQIVPKYHPYFLKKDASGKLVPDLEKLFDPKEVIPYSAGEMQRLVNKKEYEDLSEVEKNWFALGDYGVGEHPQGTYHDQGVAYARDIFRNRDAMQERYKDEVKIRATPEDFEVEWHELNDPTVDAELQTPFAEKIKMHLRHTPQTYTVQGPRGADTETTEDDFPGDTPTSIWDTPWLRRYLEKWGWVGGEDGLTFEQWMQNQNIDPYKLQVGETLKFDTPYTRSRE